MMCFSKLDIMNPAESSSIDNSYDISRQKNNEAARRSRLKRKQQEIEMAKTKEELEITYIELQRQIEQIKSLLSA